MSHPSSMPLYDPRRANDPLWSSIKHTWKRADGSLHGPLWLSVIIWAPFFLLPRLVAPRYNPTDADVILGIGAAGNSVGTRSGYPQQAVGNSLG